MIKTKITGVELTVELSQKQVDNLNKKPVYLEKKLKNGFYSISGIDLVIFPNCGSKIILDIDQPEDLEKIKSRLLAVIVKHLN